LASTAFTLLDPPLGTLSAALLLLIPALDAVGGSGDDGGDDCFGFQFANPAGLGRGCGALSEGGFAALVSNAAILSRREPSLGLGGVLEESDMIRGQYSVRDSLYYLFICVWLQEHSYS